eukprot:2820642-Pyramimonas_sp.AAC.1
MRTSEPLLVATMADWEERVNAGKTERLVISGHPRSPYDARRQYEVPHLRHIGGIHHEDGRQTADTARRVHATKGLIRTIARGWSQGTAHGRGWTSGVNITTRLAV